MGRIMHNRYIALIVTGTVVFLLFSIAGCRRASPEGSALPSTFPSPTQAREGIASTSTQVEAYPQPTAIITTQTTPEAYPQPVLPSTVSQTGIPYPYPQPRLGFNTQPSIQTSRTSTTSPPAFATQTPTQSPTATRTEIQPSPTHSPTATQTAIQPSSTSTATNTAISQYPGPQTNETQPYPGPGTNETQPYPGPQTTSTPSPTQSGTQTPPATSPTPGTASATPQGSTTIPAPAGITGTPLATPTEFPPRPPLTPPPPGSNVTIWHSWDTAETQTLRTIIKSFQRLYPDITFNLLYIPLDELFTTYQEASYLGRGPGLLLGPAEWGLKLFDERLISDLTPFVPSNYLSRLNPAALDSGRYEGALISLPLSQHGVVMFRNTAIIPVVPQSFERLSQLSHDTTRAGIIGTYLERGAYFSSADILGLGGSIMNDAEQPTINDAYGLEWIDLLHAYDQAGAVTFNTNLDLDMFMRGRVGLIIDGTWNISALTQAIGADKLAIDPWPTYGSGHLSGWVQADSVFLNSNITGNDRFAALAFMGYLLDPNVQVRLAEVGQIPSVTTAKPRDPLIQQAMQAFSNGVAYPIAVDDNILNLYWSELNTVIRDVYVSGIDPEDALKAASDQISQILLNSTPAP